MKARKWASILVMNTYRCMYRDYGTKYTPTYGHEYRLGYVYEIRDMVFQFPDTGVQLTRTCVHTGMVRLPFHPHSMHVCTLLNMIT